MPRQRSITYQQKLALREQRQLQPRASNLDLKQWFEKKYDQPVSNLIRLRHLAWLAI
ncbi:uncharacterized protein BCR38DRAFT_436293 [Pseudomassariella vexata]|uniref:ARS-binding protein 1 N-terminal domain-containing protein n=1 Tax=Pseudomassariella vexata TaxID=1141098 RepID=A0A1Y2DVG7_9PEZI|nr:uncharacterized protein BCR38DRAFT_436293 [Pseudomassariella vexata]ORY63243.1 hypothetical protein BCR38DRAFT_436293 [Pseudomassariella vexata]